MSSRSVSSCGVSRRSLRTAAIAAALLGPLTEEEMERILQRAYATPKALVQRAAEFNGSGGP